MDDELSLADHDEDEVNEISKQLWGPGVNSANRLIELLSLTTFANHAVFWKVFCSHWDDCDDTWDLQEKLLDDLEYRSEGYLPEQHLSERSKDFFDRLPATIDLYRGCSRSRLYGVSWTTDLKVAEGFARGHRGIQVPNAGVASAQLAKRDIFTVMTDREESEVIVRPDRLRRVMWRSSGASDFLPI